MQSNYSILTAQNVQLQLPFATLGDRSIAFIVDFIIKLGYVIFLNLTGLYANSIIVSTIFFFPLFTYHFLLEYLNDGQSIGKSLVGIKVVAIDGSNVTFGAYLIRWVFRIIDFNLFTPVVALISVSISDQNQRVGDRFANTTVISVREKRNLRSSSYIETRSDHYVQYPEVEHLSFDQIQLIRDTLNAYKVERRPQLIHELAGKVAQYLGIAKPEKSHTFLTQLLKDYNHIKKQEIS